MPNSITKSPHASLICERIINLFTVEINEKMQIDA
uniref:Uncharacterized protein n=1 Tax=Arundo donax TaxID=35708 RepID=A0A0A9G5A5_ARUDO